MTEFMTLSMLATFTGLVTAVIIIVQFTKSIVKDKFGDGSVRIYTFIIALVLSFIFIKNGFTVEGIALTIINSIIVTVAALGGYEAIADPKATKSK